MVGLRIFSWLSLWEGSDDQAHERGSTFAITLPPPTDNRATVLSKVDKQARRCSSLVIHDIALIRYASAVCLVLAARTPSETHTLFKVRKFAQYLGASSA